MSNYLKNLIKQGEHLHQDFKFEISDSRKIAKSLVAFSNTDGGKLLVGVKDNGAIAGVRSEEEYYMLEAAAKLYSKPEVSFSARKWEIEKKTVLEVEIPKSVQIPHYAQDKQGKWWAYVRVNDQNILADSIMLQVWKRMKIEEAVRIRFSENEKKLLFYLTDNKKVTLSEFYKLAHITQKRARQIIVDFILLELIEIVQTEKETYFRAGKNFCAETISV